MLTVKEHLKRETRATTTSAHAIKSSALLELALDLLFVDDALGYIYLVYAANVFKWALDDRSIK